jgi:hypothetical protein
MISKQFFLVENDLRYAEVSLKNRIREILQEYSLRPILDKNKNKNATFVT